MLPLPKDEGAALRLGDKANGLNWRRLKGLLSTRWLCIPVPGNTLVSWT